MRQNLLTIVLIIAILATGFVWFRYTRREPGPAAQSGEQRETLAQYRRLKNLKIDTSVFSDPLFLELERPGSGAGTEPGPIFGRKNPFTPF